jgi:hypothetical protein
MAEITNLRQARKRKQREEKERAAAANRALHGRTRSEADAVRLAQELTERRFSGHRRDAPDAAD